MNSMLDYIKKEKEINLSILNNHNLFQNIDFLDKKYRDIVVFATGSSSNAANSARLFMQDILKIPVYIKEPSISLNYENQWNIETLYIAISQGGHSSSTIEIVKYCQENNVDIYVLTSDFNSPIGKVSNKLIDLGMGIETMPYVTAGFTATILVLWLLAIELAVSNSIISQKEKTDWLIEIENTIVSADDIILKTDEWYDINRDDIINKKRFIFIGYGACYGTALEAETKFTETIHMPAHGHELEEYMHGPYLGLNKKDFLVLIDSDGKLKNRMNLLRVFLDKHMDRTYKITLESSSNQPQDLSLGLKIEENLAPLVLTIPFHMISYYVSKEHGVNLFESYYPDFDEITKSKV